MDNDQLVDINVERGRRKSIDVEDINDAGGLDG